MRKRLVGLCCSTRRMRRMRRHARPANRVLQSCFCLTGGARSDFFSHFSMRATTVLKAVELCAFLYIPPVALAISCKSGSSIAAVIRLPSAFKKYCFCQCASVTASSVPRGSPTPIVWTRIFWRLSKLIVSRGGMPVFASPSVMTIITRSRPRSSQNSSLARRSPSPRAVPESPGSV
jgi:hypothetical protein